MQKQQVIQQFIDKQLEFRPLVVDSKKLLYGGVADYITEILLSSKWRIGKLTPELRVMVQNKVRASVASKEPIVLIIAEGGFKNHKCISSPHPDFAELMQVLFVINSVRMISQIYEPGISIEYSHDGDVLSYIANYPLRDIKQYIADFGNLLKAISRELPDNISLKQTSFADFYDYEEMTNKIDKRITQRRDLYLSKITDMEERLRHARNNFLVKGEKDLRVGWAKGAEKILIDSVLKHYVWLETDIEDRTEYLEGGNRIPVAHRFCPSSLPIYSYKGSDMQFWVANGVIDLRGETRFRLVSPNDTKVKNTKEVILESPVLGLDFLAKVTVML